MLSIILCKKVILMVNIKIRIIFNNFQGIDENSSKQVREIIEKERNRVYVKKLSEELGVNTIKSGEKIPDRIAGITFRLEGYEKEVISEKLSQIINEIEDVGYEFTYEFCPACIIFDDGGIDKKVLEDTINKKRLLGHGKIESSNMKMVDLNTKKPIICTFTLECDNENFIELLFEIVEDFKKLRYSFEVGGH